MSSLTVPPARPEGTPCANPLRQHVCGVLHKSQRRPLLKAPLPTGRMPSGMGSTPSGLAESAAHTRQIEPRSGQVISEQFPLRRVDAPSADGSENLGDLWRSRGWPLRLRRQLSLPDLLFEGRECIGPRMAQPPLRVPPIAPFPQAIRRIKKWGHPVLLVAPLWKNQPWLSELTQLLKAAPFLWDGTSCLKRTGQFGTLGPICRPCTSGHLLAVCLLQRSMRRPAGPRHPHLLGFITWTYWPYRPGSSLLNGTFMHGNFLTENPWPHGAESTLISYLYVSAQGVEMQEALEWLSRPGATSLSLACFSFGVIVILPLSIECLRRYKLSRSSIRTAWLNCVPIVS